MKDFGKILEKWENYSKKPKKNDEQSAKIHNLQKSWLEGHEIEDKDSKLTDEGRRDTLRQAQIPIDAEIDLHGLTRNEAETALESFFSRSVRLKHRKVLIIHGKGKHSSGEPVLKRVVYDFLEKNPHAGKTGTEKLANGGSGATWVLLKNT